MAHDSLAILAQWEILNNKGSEGLVAARNYVHAKAPGGDELTESQRDTLLKKFIVALAAIEEAASLIRAELAS